MLMGFIIFVGAASTLFVALPGHRSLIVWADLDWTLAYRKKANVMTPISRSVIDRETNQDIKPELIDEIEP